MNSSISISENGWRRLLWQFAAWVLAIGIILGGSVIALDPYDTGRFAMAPSVGVPKLGQRLVDASLGRQPQFDTAIIGNSTMQLIEPEKLDKAGVHAVSLTMPGTGPEEQAAVADWFLRHHPGNQTRALVIGLDRRWCEANQPPDVTHPFPFWLYGKDQTDYLTNMMQYRSLELAGRKIGLMLGRTQPLRADGFNDYNLGRTWNRAAFVKRLAEPTGEDTPELSANPPYHFEAKPILAHILEQAPDDATVVLVMPPRFSPNISLRSSSGAQQMACRDAYEALAAQRPHTQLLDFVSHTELTSREEDYWDRDHYRGPVAEVIEEGIRAVLAGQKR